jgi:type II secretory pathway component PulJ
MELLVSLAISAILIAGVIQLALATTASYRLQQSLAAMQENARFALQMIGREAEHAGYHPEPWTEEDRVTAVSPESTEQLTAISDRITFTRRSNRNCFANENPVTDESGLPLHYLLESSFRVTDSGSLSQTCKYGPNPANLTTQLNGLGLVQNVEALQALYAEDTDNDGNADRWVKAGTWLSEIGVVGIKLAVLLASPGEFDADATGNIDVLDETIATPNDGRLRRTFTAAMAIKGRNG